MSTYIPRAKRLELEQQKLQQQQQSSSDTTSNNETNNNNNNNNQLLQQDLQTKWKLMHRAINAAVNRVTVENIELIVDDLFAANIRRGRGIFCSVISNAQLVSPHLSDVFCALVAKINSRVPEVGELLLRRLMRQLWQQLKLRQNENIKNTCIFLCHLSMSQVCSVVVVLKLLALFLCSSGVSTQRVLVAAAIFSETYEFLERDYPEPFGAVLEPARQLVEEGQLDARAEEALDGVLKLVRQLQMRKEKDAKSKNLQTQFSKSAVSGQVLSTKQIEEKQKNEQENQKKAEVLKRIVDEAAEFGQCHEEVDVDLSSAPPDASPQLDRFPATPKDPQELKQLWEKEDEEYFNSEEIKSARLSEDRRRALEEHVSAVSLTQVPRSRTAAEQEGGTDSMMLITPSEFTGIADAETAKSRQEIYLAFQSSIRSEEIVHKLLGTVAAIASRTGGNQKKIARQQQLIVSMVIQSAIKEKSFDPLYANVADLLCRSSTSSQFNYRLNFEEAFRIAYKSSEEYVRKQIGILASLFASLLEKNSMDWKCLNIVDLRAGGDEIMNASQRIFLEDLLKELAAALSMSKLADMLHFDENIAPHVENMFPKSKTEDSQWASAFYISINMRPLAAILMEKE